MNAQNIKLIAFANPEAPKKVSLVCATHENDDPKGVRQFIVLNGAWHGSWEGGVVTVGGVGTKIPAVLIWEGPGDSSSYQSLIERIEREIA